MAKEPVERIRRSTSAPQGAFGAVDRSGEIFAEAARKAAAEFEAVAKRRQEDWDKAKVNEAVSRYLKWDQETRFDPQKGLMFTTGANAKGLCDRSLDVYENQAETMAGELENERQRLMFREAIMPHERAATFALSRQEATEVRKWNAEQAEERLKNEAVTLAAGFDSPEAVDAAISSARQVNLTINGDQGQETNGRNETEVMRRLVGYGLDSLVNTDPLRAEAMLERFRDVFDGVSYEKLRQAVSGAALEAHLQQDTPLLFEEYGFDGLAGAREYIRDNYSGDEEEKRISAAESYWRKQWSDRKFREEKSADDILGMMDAGASLKAVNDAIAAVDWTSNGARLAMERERDEHFHIGDFAPGGAGFRINWDAVMEVDELRKNGKILEVCPTMSDFKEKYGALVGSEVLKEFRKYYNELSKGASDVEVEMEIGYTSIFKDKLKKAGIKDISEQGRWQAIYQARFDAMKNDKDKSGPITPEMAIELMDMILAPEVVGQKKGALGFNTDIMARWGEIPLGAERGADGRWYIADEYGHYRPIIFPGTEGSAGTAEIDWDLPPVM